MKKWIYDIILVILFIILIAVVLFLVYAAKTDNLVGRVSEELEERDIDASSLKSYENYDTEFNTYKKCLGSCMEKSKIDNECVDGCESKFIFSLKKEDRNLLFTYPDRYLSRSNVASINCMEYCGIKDSYSCLKSCLI